MSFSLYELKASQTVEIYGTAYTVKGMAEFRQGIFFWKEYTLESFSKRQSWLSVERDEQIPACTLFQIINADFPPPGADVVYEGTRYILSEAGRAEVVQCFGPSGVSAGDTVDFAEYRAETGTLLSREQRRDAVEYALGSEVPKTEIMVDGAALTDMLVPIVSASPQLSWGRLSSLRIGQDLEIRGTRYCVMGSVHYRQGAFRWVEYDVRSDAGITAWLSVDPSPGGACELSLHESISAVELRVKNSGASNVWIWNGVRYELTEQGRAVVTDYEGDGDYDWNESFSFSEYRSESGEILTYECWEDEQEASVGRELDQPDLKILAVSNFAAAPSRSKRATKHIRRNAYFIAVALYGLLMFLLNFGAGLFNSAPSIARQIASSSAFTHVTSVTMAAGVKGEVYSTKLSVDAACRLIIAMDPERIRFVTTTMESVEEGEEPERMLQTSRESVMIYQSEDSAEGGVTYVQVSAVKDDMRTYNSYRARRPLRLGSLYSGSRRWAGQRTNSWTDYNIDPNRYSAEVASARQASVSARRSAGGGSGFGK